MLESVTAMLGSALLGISIKDIVTGVAGNEAHVLFVKGRERLWQRLLHSPLDPKTGLPKNHDVQRASRDALRAAAHLLVREVAQRVTPRDPFAEAMPAWLRSGFVARVFPVSPGHDPCSYWVEMVRQALDRPVFDAWHDQGVALSGEQVQQCFDGGNVCTHLQPVLSETFLSWARTQSHTGEEPAEFAELATHGWLVGNVKMTLAQAFCLFFREALKQRPEVARIYLADLLGEVKTDVNAIPDRVQDALARELGPLIRLGRHLDALPTNLEFLQNGQAEVRAILVELNARSANGESRAEAAREDFSRHLHALADAFKEFREDLHGLPLIRPGIPPPPRQGQSRSDLSILEARARATALVGREGDMESLWAWLHGDAPISLRLLVGRAGAGKTRLAYELLWRLAAEQGGEWAAGRVDRADLDSFEAWTRWRWTRPTLVVVDYAQAVTGPLGRMVRALCERCEAGHPPLRVLLLDREASAVAGWFHTLLASDSRTAGPPARELFDPPEPLPLATLDSPAQRRSVLADALGAVARFLGDRPALPLPEPGVNPELEARLGADTWADPLYLLMAALVAHRTRDLTSALRFGRVDLAREVAGHEARRLAHFVQDDVAGERGRLLNHLAAIATLRGGLFPREVLPTVTEELNALGRQWPGGPGALAEPLRAALPGLGEEGVGAIQPDIVAEGFVLDRLNKCGPESGAAAVVRAARLDAGRVAVRLWHAGQNFFTHEELFGRLLTWIDACIEAGRVTDFNLLIALEGTLPHQTTHLRKHAASVTKVIYEKLKSQPLDEIEKSGELARIANNLANQLGNVGRREEALAAGQEAVALRRDLAAKNPDAFTPNLATSLGALGSVLLGTGRAAEAAGIFAEGARSLTPYFVALPPPYAGVITALCRDHLAACEQAGSEPDMATLGPIAAVLQRMQSPERSEETP